MMIEYPSSGCGWYVQAQLLAGFHMVQGSTVLDELISDAGRDAGDVVVVLGLECVVAQNVRVDESHDRILLVLAAAWRFH